MNCRLCGEYVEDEVHIVLMCPFLRDLRSRFIPDKYIRQPSLFKIVLLIASKKRKDNEEFSFIFILFIQKID